MTEQDKQLLLVDLCGRLPYGVKCQFEDTIRITDGESDPFYDYVLSARDLDLFINHKNFYIKPYLRPLSSMTEEEKDEYHSIQSDIWKPCGTQYYDNWHSIDWLNAHHFDYRGLIEKGLAISTEEFNPYES